jgi:signal transduction histidine kinase
MNISSLKFAIPRTFLWVVITACLLPVLFNSAGINFPAADRSFWHLLFDLTGVCIALMTVILCFVDFRIKGDVSTPVVGLALLGSAVFDIVHLLASHGIILKQYGVSFISVYTWLISRIFNASVLLAGAALFLRQSDNLFNNVKKFTLKFFVLSTSVVLVITGVLISISFPGTTLHKYESDFLPAMISGRYDMIPLVIYLISLTIIFPKFYSNHPSIFSQTLLLSLIPSIAAQLHLIAGTHVTGTSTFFSAHFDRVLSYLVPFIGISFNYLQTHNNERRTINALSRESHEKKTAKDLLHGVLNASADAIIVFRSVRSENEIIDFECILLNPSAKKLFEPDDTFTFKKLFTDEKTFQDYVKLADADCKSISDEYYQETSDRWFKLCAVKFNDGFTLTFSDITIRKKDEILYRTLAAHMPDTEVLLYNLNYKVILADGHQDNPLLTEREKLIGENIHNVLKHLQLELNPSLLEMQMDNNSVEVSSGDNFFKFQLLPVRDSNNKIFAGMLLVKNITELKSYQFELERKIEDLNRSNIELEQFAYVASHDLQEPLRKITSFADRLKSKTNSLNEESLRYIDRMHDAGLRMQKLIDELLNFSRTSSIDEPHIKVDLNNTINTVLNDLEIHIEQSGAVIKSQSLPVINAIPSQIQRLFQNIISNSIKFRKQGVRPVIEISGKITSSNELKIKGLHGGKNYVMLNIKDNGIGFEPEHAEKIFVIFQRLHSRSQFEGSGIGLAICKKIVENHNGKILASSEKEKGTQFTILLPVKLESL